MCPTEAPTRGASRCLSRSALTVTHVPSLPSLSSHPSRCVCSISTFSAGSIFSSKVVLSPCGDRSMTCLSVVPSVGRVVDFYFFYSGFLILSNLLLINRHPWLLQGGEIRMKRTVHGRLPSLGFTLGNPKRRSSKINNRLPRILFFVNSN